VKTVATPSDAWSPLRLLRTIWRQRCPACGEGALFAGLTAVAPTCERCGVRFERESGSFTGPVVLGYTVGAAAAAIVGVAVWARYGLFAGFEWMLVAVAALAALLSYRPCKAAWIWLLWAAGLVFRDDAAEDAARSEDRGPRARPR